MLLSASCGSREQVFVAEEGAVSAEDIVFYSSKEEASAFEAIPQLRDLLSQGHYAEAERLSNTVDLTLAIDRKEGCRLVVFSFCYRCKNGTCEVCGGKGDCIVCNGSGRCGQCEGIPQAAIPCMECVCKSCRGNGVCGSCSGRRKTRCGACRGTGSGDGYKSIHCTKCKGSGRIEWRLSGGTRSCEACRGLGRVQGAQNECATCSGTAVLGCRSCASSGRCRTCHGLGRQKDCHQCKGYRQVVSVCKSCAGSGKCGKCDGLRVCTSCQGRKSCGACNGTSVHFAHSIWINKSWLLQPGGTHVVGSQLARSIKDETISYKGRTITVSHNLNDAAIVLLANTNEYFASAGYLFTKE